MYIYELETSGISIKYGNDMQEYVSVYTVNKRSNTEFVNTRMSVIDNRSYTRLCHIKFTIS